MLKSLTSALVAAPLLMGAAPAFAGNWVVDLGQCPDHLEDIVDRREDRRDAKHVTGWRDLREDIRDRRENRFDERVTNCPARALIFDHTIRGDASPKRKPNGLTIYRSGGGYVRFLPNGRAIPVATIPARERDVQRFQRKRAERRAAKRQATHSGWDRHEKSRAAKRDHYFVKGWRQDH